MTRLPKQSKAARRAADKIILMGYASVTWLSELEIIIDLETGHQELLSKISLIEQMLWEHSQHRGGPAHLLTREILTGRYL